MYSVASTMRVGYDSYQRFWLDALMRELLK